MRPAYVFAVFAVLAACGPENAPLNEKSAPTLAPGAAPHDAHSHAHEEIVLIREGTLEFTIAGKATQAGPGSVTYMASNIHHGLRNAGTTTARYFVIALGRALAT